MTNPPLFKTKPQSENQINEKYSKPQNPIHPEWISDFVCTLPQILHPREIHHQNTTQIQINQKFKPEPQSMEQKLESKKKKRDYQKRKWQNLRRRVLQMWTLEGRSFLCFSCYLLLSSNF